MVDFDESIYNLIPKEQYVPEKPKRYKSQYPPNMAPTASTFGLKTTSKPVCSNLSGKFNLEGGHHANVAAGATMGAPKGALKPDTTGFRKKGTGNPVLVAKQEGKCTSPNVDVKPGLFSQMQDLAMDNCTVEEGVLVPSVCLDSFSIVRSAQIYW